MGSALVLDDLFVSEDAMQERAANSAVAVGERVDGLELCVEQGGFGNRMYVFAITEAHEVIETKVQSGGVRGNEHCAVRTVSGASNPYLLVAQSHFLSGTRHKGVMDIT